MWSLLYDIEWRSKVTPINILISGLRLAVLAAVVLSIVVAANGRVLALSVGGIQLKDEDGVTALISPRSVSGNSTVSGPEAKSPPTTPVSPLPSLATIDSRPVLLNRPQPSYTTKAREKGIQGIVRARVLVGADGTIKKCRILTGLPYGLSYQAIDAASQMRFKPAMKGGQPVAFLQAVEIEFKLRER